MERGKIDGKNKQNKCNWNSSNDKLTTGTIDAATKGLQVQKEINENKADGRYYRVNILCVKMKSHPNVTQYLYRFFKIQLQIGKMKWKKM